MNYPSVLGRAGSNEVPFFGNLLNLAQSIMVNRENQASRAETVKKINERLNSPLPWPRLGIFVEGTCSNRKALLEFKPGAFIPGLPVQPVCFKYPNRIDSISWCWKGPSFWWLLWLTLSQFHNRFEIHFLPTYHPNEEEKKNPILFANNVRAVMAKYLDVPVTDYSFEDFLLMSKFEKINIPYEIDQVNVNKIKKQLGYDMFLIYFINLFN
jgi:lysophosphatidylcholine acyltransferase / lyso-PAF acetyltransferase